MTKDLKNVRPEKSLAPKIAAAMTKATYNQQNQRDYPSPPDLWKQKKMKAATLD